MKLPYRVSVRRSRWRAGKWWWFCPACFAEGEDAPRQDVLRRAGTHAVSCGTLRRRNTERLEHMKVNYDRN